jgi:hypothetical protein
MPYIHAGRFTAQSDHPFVVFLIGMRVNQWWRVDKWLPVAQAMGPMIRTLMTNPDKGLLHVEYFANLRGPLLVQYWRSFDALEAFATTLPIHITLRGGRSTMQSARVASWASGTRPTWLNLISTNASTATCRALAWVPHTHIYQR